MTIDDVQWLIDCLNEAIEQCRQKAAWEKVFAEGIVRGDKVTMENGDVFVLHDIHISLFGRSNRDSFFLHGLKIKKSGKPGKTEVWCAYDEIASVSKRRLKEKQQKEKEKQQKETELKKQAELRIKNESQAVTYEPVEI